MPMIHLSPEEERKIERSNLPVREKSKLLSAYERFRGHPGVKRGMKHVSSFGETARSAAESVAVGGVLGALHVKMASGLDIQGKIPADGLLAVAGWASSIALPGEKIESDLRNIGNAAGSVFAFRKAYDYLAQKQIAAGGAVGGQMGHAATTGTPATKVAGEFGFGSDWFGAEQDNLVAASRYL